MVATGEGEVKQRLLGGKKYRILPLLSCRSVHLGLNRGPNRCYLGPKSRLLFLEETVRSAISENQISQLPEAPNRSVRGNRMPCPEDERPAKSKTSRADAVSAHQMRDMHVAGHLMATDPGGKDENVDGVEVRCRPGTAMGDSIRS